MEEKNENTRKKQCPFCGEDILEEAILCKHCGSKLNTESEKKSSPVVENVAPTDSRLSGIPDGLFGMLACGVMLAGSVIMFFSQSRMFAIVAVLTVIVAAVCVALEAYAVGAGTENDPFKVETGGNHPLMWLCASAVTFFLLIPKWMSRRVTYGLPNLFWAGVAATVLFVGSLLMGGGHSVTAKSGWSIQSNLKNACINNLRQISGAQDQVLLNYPALGLTDELVQEYLETPYMQCPAGGGFYDLTRDPPVCPNAYMYPDHRLP